VEVLQKHVLLRFCWQFTPHSLQFDHSEMTYLAHCGVGVVHEVLLQASVSEPSATDEQYSPEMIIDPPIFSEQLQFRIRV
jgi:hypothetical protein